MLQPVLITPPQATPIDVADAKAHLRVDHSDEDTLIEGLIAAAVGHLDGRAGVLGRAIMEQTWKYAFWDWPALGKLVVDLADVTSVVVKYFDEAGAEQTLDPSNYFVESDARGTAIWFKSTFDPPALSDDRPGPIRIEVTAKLAEDSPALAAVKHAMRLMVGHWYENREAAVVGQVDIRTLPLAVDALLAPHRRVGL
jgi:uncharacterized phiE125 gp8 family phage protein